MAKVYVIHENGVWVEPLRLAFAELGTPYEEWFLDRGVLDLRAPPPEGVFYNRMSASSHTRGHRFAAEYTGAVLSWLERHGRLVVNDGRALRLEISKVAQYEALAAFGVRTPDTLAVVGKQNIAAAAEALGFAAALGLDPRAAWDVVRHGAAGSFMLDDRGARMLDAEFEPVRSALDIFVKDMGLVVSAAKGRKLPTPLAAAAEQLYLAGSAEGLGRRDDASLVTLYERWAGRKLSVD